MPIYSILLGGVGLLGFMAIAAGINVDSSSQAAPALFGTQFPAWFAGVAYATIAIAALVPAAIMSIAAANLFTRNIYRSYFRPNATAAQETKVSKLTSLFVKFGALLFILALDNDYTLNLQLLGGIWLLQVLPTVLISLFTRWFHRWALVAGWLAGVAYGTIAAYNVVDPVTGKHFAGSVAAIPGIGISAYIALPALVLNLLVGAIITVAMRAAKVQEGLDITRPGDYLVTGEEQPAHQPGASQVAAGQGDLDDRLTPAAGR
jgi:SSS family solute:Na+ symporter